MSFQRMICSRRILLGGLAVAAAWFAFRGDRAGSAGQQTSVAETRAVAQKSEEDRPDDRAAIRKALDGLAAAFREGDSKAVAAQWTAEGEYTSDDGTNYQGRPALAKAYTEFFAKNRDNALAIEVASIRFPSRDTALIEGHLKLRKGKNGELIVSKCNFLFAREDGRWLIAVARELPGDGLTLRDLEWLIGSWEAKRDGTVVATTYEWTSNKSFIRCRFSVTQDGKTQTGLQMIGKMPSTGGLHVWTFEDSGGIGDADVEREGKKWVHTARGSTADGRVVTGTNILTPIDNDSFLWQVVERTVDDEAMPDLPQIKVTRVKSR